MTTDVDTSSYEHIVESMRDAVNQKSPKKLPVLICMGCDFYNLIYYLKRLTL